MKEREKKEKTERDDRREDRKERRDDRKSGRDDGKEIKRVKREDEGRDFNHQREDESNHRELDHGKDEEKHVTGEKYGEGDNKEWKPLYGRENEEIQDEDNGYGRGGRRERDDDEVGEGYTYHGGKGADDLQGQGRD